ncbi:MAG: hypothetical protein JWO85_690 [Candidatus Eremiobacteraeota bacterium]|nr:hypothetical protein [Candidatus Eremiobacteraeota bacterium]
MSRCSVRSVSRLASAAALGAALMLALPALAETEAEHAASAKAELAKMHWAKGSLTLGGSHGTFTVPNGGKMLTGTEAQRADQLINGSSALDNAVEGFAEIQRRALYVSYVGDGFVSTDDWKDVDADKLLKEIVDATDSGNEQRTKNGVSAVHVDGWVQKPTFDSVKKSVRWVTRAHDDSGPIVNAVALQLGRNGYERFTLVSGGSDPRGDASLLARAVGDYRFDPGFRFSDYVKGDKVAEYGIAALVGTAAGATIAKTVGFGAILLLIKKFFVLIVAALVGGVTWLRRRFAGGPSTQPESAE